MKPVLAKMTPLKRSLLFVPTALGAALLVFLVLGMSTHLFDVSLLIAAPSGLATAWFLLGPPEARLKDGRPLVPAGVKPYLFFPIALALFVAFYPFVGLFLTQIAPAQFLAWATLGISTLAAFGFAYFLVGFPRFWVAIGTAWRRIPSETKPYLSFPVGLALAAVAYFLLGLGLTMVDVDPVFAPLVAAPVGVLFAFTVAFLLFGVPRPRRLPKLPNVPGRPRPLLLGATFVVLLAPMTWLVGGALSLVPGLPGAFQLPTAVFAGAAIASAAALLLWGGPARWRRFPDYVPGVSSHVRHAAAGPTGLVVAAFVMTAWTLSGLDLVWGLVLALPAGLLAGLAVAGSLGSARPAALDVPDRVKPLVLFPLWIGVAALVTLALTAAFPQSFGSNLAAGLAVGLVVTLVALESRLVKEAVVERRAEREARARLAARRKAALSEAAKTPLADSRSP